MSSHCLDSHQMFLCNEFPESGFCAIGSSLSGWNKQVRMWVGMFGGKKFIKGKDHQYDKQPNSSKLVLNYR